MKRYSLIIFVMAVMLITGCAPSGSNGELMGVPKRPKWFEPDAYGMVFIQRGSLRVGPNDQDPTSALSQTRTVSIDAFWMDDTEITNNEYREFVYWVRDSLARQLLVDADNSEGNEYGLYNDEGEFLKLDWRSKIRWDDPEDTAILAPLFYKPEDRLFREKTIDPRQLFYDYAWIDLKKAASRTNSYNYETGTYDGGITGRQDFIVRERVNVYPDTLCWIRDFTYAYNEPLAKMYFWHPGFDEYPVVGVTWGQAQAFCNWRSKKQDDFYSSIGEATLQPYRLPTEFEWEYAARGGLQNAMYPWGGYYTRNQVGEFMANFKPLRGNYVEDNGMYTMKVGLPKPPNEWGLYDMAGNVAEWTSSAYSQASMSFVSDLNPDFKYNASPDDQPAMKRKVIRGGSWKDMAFYIQTSTRTYEYQDSAMSYIGFRCVRSSFGNEFK